VPVDRLLPTPRIPDLIDMVRMRPTSTPLRDADVRYSRGAAVAKPVATNAAMTVTPDAVQVFGRYGNTRDYRVGRYVREAKITQIFEGTNQIQRLVISRQLRAAAESDRKDHA
jgi:alkylation response protein AidB-like acyl-CoA dehydrogenase